MKDEKSNIIDLTGPLFDQIMVDCVSFREPRAQKRMPVPLDRSLMSYEQRKKAEEDIRKANNRSVVRGLTR